MESGINRGRRKERWVTAVFFILSGIISSTWSSRIPEVQQKFGLNNAAWGTVLFAIPVGLVAGLTLASWLVSRFGTRLMMPLSGAAAAAALCLIGLAPTVPALVLALFSMGFTRTIMNIAVNTNSLAVQELYDRPVLSSFHGLWSLACFGGVGIGTVMIAYHVRPAFHFVAIALACFILFVFVKGGLVQKGVAKERRPFFVKPDRYLAVLGLIALCAMLCESAMFDWSVHYFDHVVGVPRSLVTLGYSCFIITMALGRLAGDRAIAAFGVFRLLRINGLMVSAGFIIAAVFPYLVPAALGFLLIGLGDSILVPLLYSLAAKTKKMPPGYALASVTLIGYTGFLIGPLTIGSISQRWGTSYAFLLLGVLSLTIIFLARWAQKLLQEEGSIVRA